MADIGLNPAAWTDPRLMLAQQLMSQSTDASPVRSWTQELARALAGPVGAWEATRVRDDRTDALNDIYGGAGQTQPHPGLLQRIGNFLSGDSSQSTSTSGSPQSAPSSGGQTSGAPRDASGPTATAGQPSPVPSQAQIQSNQSAPPQSALAQQIWTYRRMMQVGQERNQPDLVMQGATGLQNIQQEIAKAQIGAQAQGHNVDFTANGGVGQFTTVPGYDEAMAGTEGAKTLATERAKLDPSITGGKIGQTNAINAGTMGTEAAKAGAVEGAQAGARNASDLAYAAPLTTARDQAAADVALKNKPQESAATTAAVNAVNAGKPLTPLERNDQEQKLSEQLKNQEPVKEYMAASQGYGNVLAAAKGTDKASDINLIDGLVKMFNPGATVRQATFETFMEHSQGLPDNVMGLVKSFYGNGQHLAPETRAELLAQATNRMDAARTTYGQLRDTAAAQAAAQGLDPKNVIPKFIDPLTAQEELARRKALRDQQMQPPQ